MNATPPKTVSQLFPSKYLGLSDLDGKSFNLTISRVEMVQVTDSYSKEKIWKAGLSFEGAKKIFLINKTQALALVEITGSESFADWIGHCITLSPGRAHNGKPTIVISKPRSI